MRRVFDAVLAAEMDWHERLARATREADNARDGARREAILAADDIRRQATLRARQYERALRSTTEQEIAIVHQQTQALVEARTMSDEDAQAMAASLRELAWAEAHK